MSVSQETNLSLSRAAFHDSTQGSICHLASNLAMEEINFKKMNNQKKKIMELEKQTPQKYAVRFI